MTGGGRDVGDRRQQQRDRESGWCVCVCVCVKWRRDRPRIARVHATCTSAERARGEPIVPRVDSAKTEGSSLLRHTVRKIARGGNALVANRPRRRSRSRICKVSECAFITSSSSSSRFLAILRKGPTARGMIVRRLLAPKMERIKV